MNRADRRGRCESREGNLLRRIEGGCDDCTAYSDLVEHGGNVLTLEIHHDASCPAYRAMERKR